MPKSNNDRQAENNQGLTIRQVSSIRWEDKDRRELNRVIKNYNAKISRLEKKYAGRKDVVLPERVTKSEITNLIGTRSDLNREMNTLKRFSERGAEKLIQAPNLESELYVTKWQVKEMNRRAGYINRTRNRRLKQIEELPMTSGGKELGYTQGELGMGKAEKLSLNPINVFTAKMDKYEIRKKYKSLRKHSQTDYFTKSDQRLYENYTNALIETYGEERVRPILDQINSMSFNQFYKTFKAETGAFEFASDIPNDADIEAYLKQVEATWVPEKRK